MTKPHNQPSRDQDPPDKLGSLGRKSSWSDRWHALVYRQLDGILDRWYHPLKHSLLWPVSGKVLEIGAGTGINFSYYRPGMLVIAVEPNRAMHERLRSRAREHRLRLEIIEQGAESLPLSDNSIPFVTGTLVLCTVKSPGDVLKEILRVIQPGGVFTFIEHVADRGGRLQFQKAVYWPWYWAAGGCCLTRDTRQWIAATGFENLQVEERQVGPAWLPMRSHIVGSATKPIPQ